jgi:hypothetical protein
MKKLILVLTAACLVLIVGLLMALLTGCGFLSGAHTSVMVATSALTSAYWHSLSD